ncbi:MAG: hypothetical protein ACYDBB_22350 [Armatimonadota bacterium]
MRYRWILLFSLLVFGLPALAVELPVEIISVKPNKIIYNDGEAGQATVRVMNHLGTPRQVTLKPVLLWDLEDSKPLPQVTLTIPANTEASVLIPWPSPTAKWGHEIRVVAEVDGKVADTGRQFFGINSDWMDMVIVANAWEWTHGDEYPFITYTNLNHWFAWAPADYVGNAPPQDEWYAGQVAWKIGKKGIQEAIKKCHEVGVHCTFYNNSFSNGSVGVEWARRHPEWVVHERNGMPKVGGTALAMAKPPTEKETGGNGFVQIDFSDIKCVEWGAQNVLDSIAMFGWDGMFWDCGGCYVLPGFSYDGQPTPHGKDPDLLASRNFKTFHNTIRQKYPHFAFWINGSIEAYKQSFWSTFGNNGGVPTMIEQMSQPNTSMLAEFRHHEFPGSFFNDWRRCYDSYATQRDNITQRFGSPVTAGYTWGFDTAGEKAKKVKDSRTYWVAGNHLSALYLATQMHTTTNPNPSLWAGTQFMARYAGLLWRRDIKTIPDPQKLFAVNLSRPVWWDRSAYRRPAPGGEDLLLHLVNTPETETVDIHRVPDPPAATGMVTLTLPAGKTLKSAWALQMRKYEDSTPYKIESRDNKWVHTTGSTSRFGPSQVKLNAKVVGGKVTVEVPAFLFHTLLVFRLDG